MEGRPEGVLDLEWAEANRDWYDLMVQIGHRH
jgi:hypothetical protein